MGLERLSNLQKVTELGGLGSEQGLVLRQQGRYKNAKSSWQWQGPTLSMAEPGHRATPELGLELQVAGTTAH